MDKGAVYTLSRWGDLFCFNAADGKVTWSKNLKNLRVSCKTTRSGPPLAIT